MHDDVMMVVLAHLANLGCGRPLQESETYSYLRDSYQSRT
jgi:hypothetical protein